MKVLKNMPCFLEDSLSIFIERNYAFLGGCLGNI